MSGQNMQPEMFFHSDPAWVCMSETMFSLYIVAHGASSKVLLPMQEMQENRHSFPGLNSPLE